MNNYNDYTNQNFNVNNENNFINLASSIDLDNLNGTNIMDLNKENFNNTTTNIQPNFNMPSFNLPNNLPSFNNMPNFNLPSSNQNTEPFINTNQQNQINSVGQDKHLIKSITRELINNLKENNISLHDDNTTNISKKNQKNKDSDFSENYENYESYDDSENQKENKKHKKYKYKDEIKKTVENMMSENGVPVSESMSSYIFDDLFNWKDFIVLFGVYFLLSQEMIKDLFAQYFTSLNPDDTGKVHVKGVIIYGLILTVLFMVLRKLV
jgi:hypothetical protein